MENEYNEIEENEPQIPEEPNWDLDSTDMVKVNPNPQHCYYLDGIMKDNLDTMRRETLKKDYDTFVVIDGKEGEGKTSLSFQIAMYLDPTFDLNRVAFTLDQFVDYVIKASKGQCIVFDETMGYLSSRRSQSKFNVKLVKIFSEMRSKNLFIILNIPSFFELDKYPAIHRSLCLFHVDRRGFFRGYGYEKKKLLYVNGKKYYSYKNPSANFRGRFVKYFPFDKQEYETKKQEGINTFNDVRDVEKKLLKQRDALIYTANNKYNMPLLEISEILDCDLNYMYELLSKYKKKNKLN